MLDEWNEWKIPSKNWNFFREETIKFIKSQFNKVQKPSLIFFLYSDFIKNTNIKLFPPDFFEPILPGHRTNHPKKIDNIQKEDKRVFIDLSKEYEEDKELLELLEGKRKNILFLLIFIFI